MINKRSLRCLEGLLLLISLNRTESKRQTASIMGLSIDTVSKYVSLLEFETGCKLLQNFRHSCVLTAKGKDIVCQIQNICIDGWEINNRNLNLLNLKNLRGAFYLKAIAIFGNKKNAAQNLSSSIETINSYIEYLEAFLQTPLMSSDNHGSYLTFCGNELSVKFDLLINFLGHIVKTSYSRDNKIRLAIETGISFIRTNFDSDFGQDITVFADNPNLYIEDWDIAITFSTPVASDITIFFQREIKCGFFASQEYLNNFGMPRDISDIKKNHTILDGSQRPYADKKYRNLINNCQNIRPIRDYNIRLLDMARFGAGICIMPLSVDSNDLIYLDYLPCEAKATIYLSAHKNCENIPKFQKAMITYKNMLINMHY